MPRRRAGSRFQPRVALQRLKPGRQGERSRNQHACPAPLASALRSGSRMRSRSATAQASGDAIRAAGFRAAASGSEGRSRASAGGSLSLRCARQRRAARCCRQGERRVAFRIAHGDTAALRWTMRRAAPPVTMRAPSRAGEEQGERRAASAAICKRRSSHSWSSAAATRARHRTCWTRAPARLPTGHPCAGRPDTKSRFARSMPAALRAGAYGG